MIFTRSFITNNKKYNKKKFQTIKNNNNINKINNNNNINNKINNNINNNKINNNKMNKNNKLRILSCNQKFLKLILYN
jgi:hypothetical protein